VDPALNIDR